MHKNTNFHKIFTLLLTFAFHCVKIITYPQNP